MGETKLEHRRVGSATSPARAGPFDGVRSRSRDWGWRRALYWQLMHALARLGVHVHYVRIGADRLDLRDPTPPAVPPGYVTRLGCKADFVPHIGRVGHLDAEFVERAFAHGDECSLTLYGDELVGFTFCSRSRARVTPQLDVLVPKGFRYVYKEWTHPAHRRRNLARMGSWVRNFQARRPFAERSISYVETHNYASLLHAPRNPSEHAIHMGYVGWFTWFGRQIPFNSRKAKWVGLEFVRKDDHRKRQTIR